MPKVPKARKTVHPNSRHALVLQKKLNRDQRVTKSKADTTLKQDQMQQKLVWFQENLDTHKNTYTKHDLAELTSRYLCRFEDQLEQISIVNSIGNRQTTKQHVSRENAIKITLEQESNDFETVGIEVPDLINGKALSYFRDWSGELRYHPSIKLRRSKKSDLGTEQESSSADSTNATTEGRFPEYVDADDQPETN